MEFGDGALEFRLATGGGHVNPVDVPVDVEVGVAHPERVVEVEGRGLQSVGEIGHQVPAGGDERLQAGNELILTDAVG